MSLSRTPALVAALASALGLAGCTAPSVSSPGLPNLHLDAGRTTVSGISSGAYMAGQIHLAFSDHLAGAALVAGGPWHCAQGRLDVALSRCMNPPEGSGPAVEELVAGAKEAAVRGTIAPLAGLEGDRVLILNGALDTTVAPRLGEDAATLYRALMPTAGDALAVDVARPFAHTFPTVDAGSACDKSESPYLGHCGFDAAESIFRHLYGEPRQPAAAQADGELLGFDQNPYRPDGKDALLADRGYLYVPKACAQGGCGLHVAFHGCQQNADSVGEAFVRDAGYNRWADAYGVVVLYPQTRASYAPLNPKACWDWWGYSGADYDSRSGVQMRWVANAAAALGAPLQ